MYHEIFHILAHSKATPVFKKTPYCREGTFNEMLADHFAAIMLMPKDLVEKLWKETGDIDKMAAIFEVPKPLVMIALKNLNLG